MSKKKIKTLLIMLKNNTYKLRAYKQLPFYLSYLIYQLDGSEEQKYIQYLIEMSKHFLRVRGYYKEYPLEDKASENVIKEGLLSLGYTVIDVKA